MNLHEPTENLVHWLIIDTIRAPKVTAWAARSEAFDGMVKLYLHSPLEHRLAVSPVVLKLKRSSENGHEKVLGSFAQDYALRSSGVLVSFPATQTDEAVLAHLRNLLIVQIQRHLSLFQFYSSVFWQKHHTMMNVADISVVLGPMTCLSWCDEQQQWHHIEREAHRSEHTPRPTLTVPYHLTSDFSQGA
ncbi:DUF4123 domain-containing protein [Vibrio alginolyticus]|uniref:DUF4123 domain-containing protein n=1 Tax=Vibrio alginolyticus TaxID=663 RepID=UPI002119CFF4|nr:DUF4123 domain-containing protein [Vibrio alginolyticus]MCQ9087126.1 DUF4123 domain-containing protein [Vibrio alginolyticus]